MGQRATISTAQGNPFNPTTTIKFDLAQPGHGRLRIYAVDGRLVTTLVDHDLEAGRYAVPWSGDDGLGRRAASGVYFYRLEAGAFGATRRMLLLK